MVTGAFWGFRHRNHGVGKMVGEVREKRHVKSSPFIHRVADIGDPILAGSYKVVWNEIGRAHV